MDFTISLAHFCEVHGPTSIICTQAIPSPCSTCHPCVTPPTEDGALYGTLYDPPTLTLPALSSPFESPPTSPRSPTHNPYFPSFPSSSGSIGHRRASSTFDADPDTCENCSIVLPKEYTDRMTGPASPKGKAPSVLRTSKNYPVRSNSRSGSPESPDVSDNEHSRSFDSSQSYSDSSPPSPAYSESMHTHTLTYISTSQPQSPETYSRLRRTCIRTLSCEALPSGKPSGPLMFGDPIAGYTIAYIFRLQDPRARGAKRTYALIAMAGRDSRRASKAMVRVTEVFEAIANRIVTLAEKVLEKEKADFRTSGINPTTPPLVQSFSKSASPHAGSFTPVSSFLSAKKVDPDGFPRVSRELMRPKTLVEIVGSESFFVDLHTWFCTLLHSLIKEFGS